MKLMFALLATAILPFAAQAKEKNTANKLIELSFNAKGNHNDPFNDLTLDVTFAVPGGKSFRVPAYWAGKDVWKVRYSSPIVGKHTYRTECSDPTDAGLHGISGVVEITPYTGDNPLYTHGFIQIAPDQRHFQHADGTPFFWLGDTWWMGLSHRLQWPDDVKKLAADRKAKGFSTLR